MRRAAWRACLGASALVKPANVRETYSVLHMRGSTALSASELVSEEEVSSVRYVLRENVLQRAQGEANCSTRSLVAARVATQYARGDTARQLLRKPLAGGH